MERLFARRRRKTPYLIFALLVLAGGGYVGWRLYGPTERAEPSPATMTRKDFADLPGWKRTDPADALKAFRASCRDLAGKSPDQPMGGIGYGGTVRDWLPVCRAAARVGRAKARDFFETRFVPYQVTGGNRPAGLFTGYFEPEIAVSRTRTAQYDTPVYGVPPDLVGVDLGRFRTKFAGEHIAGRVVNGTLLPYASRAEIDAGGIPGAPVLLYAADPIALFFLQIQGSGRGLLPDGSVVRLAFAARNGQPYTAIGRVLVREGELRAEGLSLAVIRDWLKMHPERARAVMEQNASYIFLSLQPLGDPAAGAVGSEGVPLTSGASLAVDPRFHPFGVPMFVASRETDGRSLRSVFVAQDSGGAIRGAVRADIYCGIGESAETRAGGLQSPGKLFVLLPSPLAARLGAERVYAGAGL